MMSDPPSSQNSRAQSLEDAVEALVTSAEWEARLQEARESRARVLAGRRPKVALGPLVLRSEWTAPQTRPDRRRRTSLFWIVPVIAVIGFPSGLAIDAFLPAPVVPKAPEVAPDRLTLLRTATGDTRLRIHLPPDEALRSVENAEILPSGFGVAQSIVRFYNASDAAVARRAGQSIAAQVEDMTAYSRTLPEGTIEIWLGPAQ